jgi:uncharacterized membrane protein YtjA (UPF0391 family)
MLRWTVIFLVVAIIAALFGFTGIAGASIGIAKVLFYIFLALFVITLLAGGTLFKGMKDITRRQP